MKKYFKPEIEIKLFDIEDVITESAAGEPTVRQLKTAVNGNEGANFGSEVVSVFAQ